MFSGAKLVMMKSGIWNHRRAGVTTKNNMERGTYSFIFLPPDHGASCNGRKDSTKDERRRYLVKVVSRS